MNHAPLPDWSVVDTQATRRAVSQDSTMEAVLHGGEQESGPLATTPVEQSETNATDSFAAFREEASPSEERSTSSHGVNLGTNHSGADSDATAIGFPSRRRSRLFHYRSRKQSQRMLTETKLPGSTFPNDSQS